MTERVAPDIRQRHRALDPTASFIVQAPAGSGKTELLTQRFLRLLAMVAQPEEVVAITFTRKAAGEMRARILAALERGRDAEPPPAAHARSTWQLARGVLERDLGWRLLEHPGRLRVQTIDALCAGLTRRMPLLAGFGAPPAVSEQPGELYREAARATVLLLEADPRWAEPVARLLDHVANDIPALERLLAELLARRDQWLGHVSRARHEDLRPHMEAALARLVTVGLGAARQLAPPALAEILPGLAGFAAANLGPERESIHALAALSDLPGTEPEARVAWLGAADLLLTAKGEWRRRVSQGEGFPPPSANGLAADEKARRRGAKEAMEALLTALAGEEAFREALAAVRELPPARLDDTQWAVVEALADVLTLAAAQLRLTFAERGEVDFAEVAGAALQALGEPDAPTDLALALDYRIRHILLDEFQDTSRLQYDLLLRLTAGWEPEDGRTLFLVGDPMQSVYRFREAEVGLYLRARRHGIGGLPLEALTLSANFRSAPAVVDWYNSAFRELMPGREDIGSGAVAYSDAAAMRDDLEGPGVHCHPLLADDPEAEARQVAGLVAAALHERPEAGVAVLVRARSHAARVVRALRAAGIGYQAVELEVLAARPAIQDLRSLTRALLHPADRVAWLSVLRAPWCGLTLADLTRLAGDGRRDRSLPGQLLDRADWPALSDGGRQRLARLAAVMAQAMAHQRRLPLDRLVRSVWLELGGPATLRSAAELEEAEVFFGLLQRLQRAGTLDDADRLDRELARLHARPDTSADHRVQVMTIHKAKGLEFDTVILPGLGRGTRGADQPLLRWLELPREAGAESDLLMAPIRRVGAEADPVYRWIGRLERQRDRHESLRLLYVATTRARRALHLVGHAVAEGERPPRPGNGSLLAYLWPRVRGHWESAAATAEPAAVRASAGTVLLRRLVSDWRAPTAPAGLPGIRAAAGAATEDGQIEYRWAGDTARNVGTVVHRLLQHWAEQGAPDAVDAARVEAMLAARGVPAPERQAALGRATAALARVLADERGRWLLAGAGDPNARCEYSVSGRLEGRRINATMDRTFVDQDGVRWVVDYKTSAHEGADLEAFLNREMERYRLQMARYAALFQALEDRPVRVALYFPLLGAWRVYRRLDQCP